MRKQQQISNAAITNATNQSIHTTGSMDKSEPSDVLNSIEDADNVGPDPFDE